MKQPRTRLRPLEQFVCDTCREIIQAPDNGWFEWLDERFLPPPRTGRKVHSFRICHHITYSPKGGKNGCYKHTDHLGRSDNHLHYILTNRIAELLWFVDVGEHHDRMYKGPDVDNFREWAEIVRRMTIPYYEQARLYWKEAEDDGFFSDSNEIYIFTEEFLKALIDKYSS